VSSACRLNQNAILPPGGSRLKFLLNFQNQNPAQPSRNFRHPTAKLYFATCENGSVEPFLFAPNCPANDGQSILVNDSAAAMADIQWFRPRFVRFDFTALLVARIKSVVVWPVAANADPRL
jgi:hypothetical protein